MNTLPDLVRAHEQRHAEVYRQRYAEVIRASLAELERMAGTYAEVAERRDPLRRAADRGTAHGNGRTVGAEGLLGRRTDVSF